ncbi:hypothetical protein PTTG_00606 [Puccinia triticina 1-1 BBBD Race 1]|uniref:Uncharacterized protein n=2 Tax=Puccinia triticina TaxID=208348 RepID=A0A0C4EIN9_PUCT1|nr:uncharacterized protein PtA15_6A713 [Puccinia triticina]OAV97184.1 hypothetical protein PTTG_00606 [Puccinia triticina 1-1 BBBD Race 1]WAQ86083.1 hypothetical protein PtA15_6A713 [Puccinia triticina]
MPPSCMHIPQTNAKKRKLNVNTVQSCSSIDTTSSGGSQRLWKKLFRIGSRSTNNNDCRNSRDDDQPIAANKTPQPTEHHNHSPLPSPSSKYNPNLPAINNDPHPDALRGAQGRGPNLGHRLLIYVLTPVMRRQDDGGPEAEGALCLLLPAALQHPKLFPAAFAGGQAPIESSSEPRELTFDSAQQQEQQQKQQTKLFS